MPGELPTADTADTADTWISLRSLREIRLSTLQNFLHTTIEVYFALFVIPRQSLHWRSGHPLMRSRRENIGKGKEKKK